MIRPLIILFTALILFPGRINSISHIRITAAGDIYISKETAGDIRLNTKAMELSGDVVFGNFEGVLSEKPPDFSGLKIILTMPFQVTELLRDMGFNTLSLSNNHVMDLGSREYNKTKTIFEKNNFHAAGLNDRGAIIEAGGQSIRFIAFSFSGSNNVNDITGAAAIIKSFQEDIVIVSAHMGRERNSPHNINGGMEYHDDEKRGNVIKFSHACVDAGADLILGHGPHVPRGIELYKNRLIVYSLGNYIFHLPGMNNCAYYPSFTISVDIDRKGNFIRATIKSYEIKRGLPVPDRTGRICNMLKGLTLKNFKDNKLIFLKSGEVVKK